MAKWSGYSGTEGLNGKVIIEKIYLNKWSLFGGLGSLMFFFSVFGSSLN